MLLRSLRLKPSQNHPKHTTHPPAPHQPQRHARLPHLLQVLLLPPDNLQAHPQLRKRPAHHSASEQADGDFVGRVGDDTGIDAMVAQFVHGVNMRHGRVGDLGVSPVLEVLFGEGRVVLVDGAAGDKVDV